MARTLKRVGIIGGGIAGLSLACLLAGRGQRVTVYERDTAGGKLRHMRVGDLVFDTGPSLFTFPGVWQAFLQRLGEDDPLELRPLDGGLGLHHTPYGDVPLPVPPEHPLYLDWLRYTRKVAPFKERIITLPTTPPRLTDAAFLKASRALFQITAPHLTAGAWLRAQHLPEALAHAIGTHALNAGLAPQDAPALYALIPALVGPEVYRPAQGMGALLHALRAFAEARGVQVREGLTVVRVDGTNLILAEGETAPHDLLVSAMDPARLAPLLGRASPSPLSRRTVSGLALYAALPQPAPLPATSVLPPSDFRHFRAAIRHGAFPPDTLALIHAEGRKLAVLLTVPATGEALTLEHPWVRGQLQRVERALQVPGLLASASDIQALSPAFYALGGHPGGAIYGAAHPAWRGGPLHPNPYRLHARLWQVGTGVHPGGGIPAILGGALIVDRLLREAGT